MQALAVIDRAGSQTVLEEGQCQLTAPEGGQPGFGGLPADGSTLSLQFDQGAQAASLDLTIELTRLAAPGPDAEASPSPAAESPSPGASPGEQVLSTEDILPFTILPELVQLSVGLPDQDLGSDPRVLAGSVAPNGLSGYVVSQTDDNELLTVNFACAESDTTGTPGASPGASPLTSPLASPAAGESPGTDASPAP